MEIERKFLIPDLPKDLLSFEKAEISQSYLDFGDGEENEKRIRFMQIGNTSKFFYTEKGKGDLIRTEDEIEITKERYAELLKKVISKTIEKTRYFIPIENSLKIELDVYKGDLSGLCTAEIEFPSKDSADSFIAPDWFGKEITFDRKYKNKNLAK